MRGVAQLGLERLVWDQEVAGSNPAAPIYTTHNAIATYENEVARGNFAKSVSLPNLGFGASPEAKGAHAAGPAHGDPRRIGREER